MEVFAILRFFHDLKHFTEWVSIYIIVGVRVCVCVCQVMLHSKVKASCAQHSLGREAPLAPRMPSEEMILYFIYPYYSNFVVGVKNGTSTTV